MWDLKVSLQSPWVILSPGTWQCVASQDCNDVSEEPTAVIFRVWPQGSVFQVKDVSYICYLVCGSFHWAGQLSNLTTFIRVSLLSFTMHCILTQKARVCQNLTCAGMLRGTLSWTVYSCKRKVARQSGLCAELLSVMCVRLCLVSKGCGCMHHLDSWFKHIQ